MHAAPFRRVVIGYLTICRVKANCAVNMAVIDELSGENSTIAYIFIVAILLFIHHVELVAGLYIQCKIDIPTENVISQPHNQIGTQSGLAR